MTPPRPARASAPCLVAAGLVLALAIGTPPPPEAAARQGLALARALVDARWHEAARAWRAVRDDFGATAPTPSPAAPRTFE